MSGGNIRSTLAAIVALLVTSVALAAHATSQATLRDLLANGGFEDSGSPTGWRLETDAGGSGR